METQTREKGDISNSVHRRQTKDYDLTALQDLAMKMNNKDITPTEERKGNKLKLRDRAPL